jgi:hypothetical protein
MNVEWPRNPISDALREYDAPIHSIAVAAVPRPSSPIGVLVRLCDDIEEPSSISNRIEAKWLPHQVQDWCAELAWVMGSPELVRTDLRAGARFGHPNTLARWQTPTLEELFGSGENPDRVRDMLVGIAAEAGLTTWSWCCLPGWFHSNGDLAIRVLAFRRDDKSLQEDGSRPLDSWRKTVNSQLGDVVPIADGKEMAICEYDLRIPPMSSEGGRQEQANPRCGMTIPGDLLSKLASLNADTASLVDRIRTDPAYAPHGEQLLAELALSSVNCRLESSPFTFEEMIALNACREGRAFGTARED